MPNWDEVINEISNTQLTHSAAYNSASDTVRKKYLGELFNKTGRNIIAYYSGFLSKPNIEQSAINDEDKNGFMMAIHNLDRSKGLDLILHTPGGGIAATESLVDYLRQMFGNNIRAIIPQIAMSAGTMIACSCKNILMAKHSNLGPIDPQISGLPAREVINEFERAYNEIKLDESRALVWQPILSKYFPTYLSLCENAIKWSKEFVIEQLKSVMFEGDEHAADTAASIVDSLLNYEDNKDHSRHISLDECIKMGLKVTRIEEDKKLQDLILTVHHCYMHSLTTTPVFKIIENQNGISFVKQQIQG